VRRFIEIVFGLVAATLVATGLTSVLALFAASVQDLVWTVENSRSVAGWLVSALAGTIGTLPFAWIFGFPGAFVVLAAVLLPLGSNPSRRSLVVAGGSAGLFHTGIGWALRLADAALGPTDPREDLLHAIVGWGGFHLTNLRLAVAIGAIPASIIAGCAAGLVFYRMTRGPSKEPRESRSA